MKINGKEPELLEPIPYGIIGVKKKKSLDCLKKKKVSRALVAALRFEVYERMLALGISWRREAKLQS